MPRNRTSRILQNKRILFGITGSVAAYKAVELIRRLKDSGASVNVVMTEASCRFITPLSVELAAGAKPFTGMFDDPLSHISLSTEADLMLVAPATADTIGRFSQGLAGDLLGACFMAFRGPVVLAPAMNPRMYDSPAFRRNLDYLKGLGVIEVEPSEGTLACGEEGKGRMAEVERIIEYAEAAFSSRDLSGRKVVVTAGPTREHMDPVRFISNRSSGRMGYAIARAALMRGAEVVLISGPVSLSPPPGVRLVSVETASEMRDAVLEEAGGSYALVMAAAVADFAPSGSSGTKLEKAGLDSIGLKPNPDILSEVSASSARPEILVGFAAETGNSLERARRKLKDKGLDFIVFNDVLDPEAGFDVQTNRVTVIGSQGETDLGPMQKTDLAHEILELALKT